MSTDGLKIGVIGLGVGAAAHIPALRAEGFDVVAVAATSRDRATAAATDAGVGAAYDDYRALLEHPGLDAVTVATPTALHRPVIMAALEAGLHVLSEKPIGLDVAEAREVRDAAIKAGRTAMIAHAFRFAPARAHVKELLEQGYVGSVRNVTATFFAGPRAAWAPGPDAVKRGPGEMHWRMTRATGGGFLDGAGSTFFDSLRDWVGELDAVTGRTFEYGPERQQPDGAVATDADADEGFVAMFTFANGALGSMTMSIASPYGSGGRIDIYGSEGTLQLVQPGLLPGPDTSVLGGRFADGPGLTELTIPDRLLIEASELDPKVPYYTAYRPLLRAFADGIASGTSPHPNFEDAYKDQQITDAILESTDTGTWVRLDD